MVGRRGAGRATVNPAAWSSAPRALTAVEPRDRTFKTTCSRRLNIFEWVEWGTCRRWGEHDAAKRRLARDWCLQHCDVGHGRVRRAGWPQSLMKLMRPAHPGRTLRP